jgi:phage gp46-like protein
MSRKGYEFEGDPQIILTEEGADLDFRGGQPIMDKGLENAVLLSLYTSEGWPGGKLDPKDERYISKFNETSKEPLTVESLTRRSNSAREALAWMIRNGVASDISVNTSNPTGQQKSTKIMITSPGKTAEMLLVTSNGANWIAQKLDPAHRAAP